MTSACRWYIASIPITRTLSFHAERNLDLGHHSASRVRGRPASRRRRRSELGRWGHYGTPLLLLPSAGADFEEVERFGLIEAFRALVESGRREGVLARRARAHPWLQAKATPDECARAQRAWETARIRRSAAR